MEWSRRWGEPNSNFLVLRFRRKFFPYVHFFPVREKLQTDAEIDNFESLVHTNGLPKQWCAMKLLSPHHSCNHQLWIVYFIVCMYATLMYPDDGHTKKRTDTRATPTYPAKKHHNTYHQNPTWNKDEMLFSVFRDVFGRITPLVHRCGKSNLKNNTV